MSRLHSTRDTWAGFTFVLIGLIALSLAPSERGDATNMAAGDFPNLIGQALLFVGSALLAFSFRKEPSRDAKPIRPDLRPFFVLPAVVVFALLLERAGLVPASFSLLALGACAARGLAIRRFLLLAAVLVPLVVAIFVWGIGLPVKVWPG
jgi:cytochrome bd-type quinol oxidase subunit 2